MFRLKSILFLEVLRKPLRKSAVRYYIITNQPPSSSGKYNALRVSRVYM